MMLTWIKKEKFRLTLCLIAGVGLFFRVWGMWFGLPFLLHPDEPIFVEKAMFFSTSSLNPHWFGHPGNNLMYILLFEFIGYYFFGRFFNWFDNVEVFRDHFLADPTVFYFLGRSVGVLTGTLSVVAIGYLSKRLVNERVGIISAVFLAVNPLCIMHSKYIRTDILGTFFIITAIYYALKFWDSRRRMFVIISSIAIGMAAASKYVFATVGIVILLLTYFLGTESPESFLPKYRQKNSHWKFFLMNCLVIVISFFMVTPFFFLLFIGSVRLKWDRWIIPIIPFVGLYAAIALDYFLKGTFLCLSKIVKKQKNMIAIQLPMLIILLTLFVFHPLKESIAINRKTCFPDTRQICTEWIKQHIPEGKFAQEWYTFQPSPRYAYFRGEYQIEKYIILQEFSIANKTLEYYRVKGFTHVIISSSLYNRYFREAERYPQEEQFYRSLFARVPLKTFEFIDNEVTGPNIAIYSID